MKKTNPVKKVSLNRETLLRLQADTDLRYVGGNGWGDTGPSCEIFRACTVGGWDC